jgi:hypothetical protein
VRAEALHHSAAARSGPQHDRVEHHAVHRVGGTQGRGEPVRVAPREPQYRRDIGQDK